MPAETRALRKELAQADRLIEERARDGERTPRVGIQSTVGQEQTRPGRIDQAIEFPLPDDGGRDKLVRLYSRGVELGEPLIAVIVRRTKGASPAFIKELMRRAAQFQFEIDANGKLDQSAVDGALEEMVFAGGTLNLTLLGGSSAELTAVQQRA